MRLLLLFSVVLGSVTWGAAAEKPRVYISDSKSWEVTGALAGSANAIGAVGSAGDRPQTAEIIKTFGERCPSVIINNKQEKADYVVLLDHEGGKGPISRDNKVVVFNKGGDSIMSASMRTLGNAVQGACGAIAADWPKETAKTADAPAQSSPDGAKQTGKN